MPSLSVVAVPGIMVLVVCRLAGSDTSPSALSATRSTDPLGAAALADSRRTGTPWRTWDRDRDGQWSALEVVIAAARSPDWTRRELPGAWAMLDLDRNGQAAAKEVAKAVATLPNPAFSVAERTARSASGRAGGRAASLTPSAGNGLGAGKAWVAFGTETSYISDYQVVNGQLDPVVSVLRSGTILKVADIIITIH